LTYLVCFYRVCLYLHLYSTTTCTCTNQHMPLCRTYQPCSADWVLTGATVNGADLRGWEVTTGTDLRISAPTNTQACSCHFSMTLAPSHFQVLLCRVPFPRSAAPAAAAAAIAPNYIGSASAGYRCNDCKFAD
jgi:hypothetical protein